jgi:Arc/MetJ-type ribon-helix-helix transcriptional regulator
MYQDYKDLLSAFHAHGVRYRDTGLRAFFISRDDLIAAKLAAGRPMEVQLTPDQKAFARRAIESGRLHSEQAAVQEAIALWEERERQRAEFLLTLDDAKASLARGEGRVITQESMQQLAQEVKERGRTRLLTELASSRWWHIA